MHLSIAGVIAFIILRDGVDTKEEDIIASLKDLVRKKIAAFAIPTAFVVRVCVSVSTYPLLAKMSQILKSKAPIIVAYL